VIRFSAFLVVVAVGLLVAGVVTSKLLLVYIAIGVSGVALLALGIGVAVNWRELTGKPTTDAAEASAPGPAASPQGAVPQTQPGLQDFPRSAPAPAPAGTAPAGTAPAGSGWPAAVPSGPSRASYLAAAEPPLRTQTSDAPFRPAAFTPRTEAPARSAWEWRDEPVPPPAQAQPASAVEAPAEAPAPQKPAQSPTPSKPADKPISPRDENAAEPPQAAESNESPDTPPSCDRPSAEGQPSDKDESGQDPASAQDQPPAGRQDDAKPEASASEPGSALAASAAADALVTSPSAQADEADEAEPAGLDPDLEVTVVPGVPRYHKARCILIRFMGDSDLDTMTLAAAREVGCTPCRACLPDQPEKPPE
jgi:hypothetical protein